MTIARCLPLLVLPLLGILGQCFDETPQKQANAKAKRIPWTTSKITGSLEPPRPYVLRRAFPKLKFVNPTVLTNLPGSNRLFVTELTGKVYSFENKDDVAKAELCIDLAASKQKALRVYGLTFHPQFAKNRTCFLCYINKKEGDDGTIVSRFRMTDTNPPTIVPESEQIILTWPAGGHNGGCLKFGPDGYLYVSTGDGGPAFPPDPRKTGQNLDDLLSCLLRIDVDHVDPGKKYAIPKDNPFVRHPGARGEIWAYGFRNPWKISFDPKTGDLWVGDVGWELWEMIYRVQKGGNYGWSVKEGSQFVHLEHERGPTPILEPTTQHSHVESRSITGGFVYRGKRLKELEGAYVYGDYVTGKIWGLRHDGGKVTQRKELAQAPIQIIGFAVDNESELYVMGYDGTIHVIVPNPNQAANVDFPRKLSETGLFSSVKEHRPAPGVIPYEISAKPWMDHATAERFVALPGTSTLSVQQRNEVQQGLVKGRWAFPKDAVLAKTISLEMESGNPKSRRRLETQVLHYDGRYWQAYNYVWNDAQTDADLDLRDGHDRTFAVKDAGADGGMRKQTWHFASRTECLLCHSSRGGYVAGFMPEQLSVGEQLRDLEALGLFKDKLPDKLHVLRDARDKTASLEDRARSYLHVNCAGCHQRGGGGTAAMELNWDRPLKRTNLLDERPTQGAFALHDAKVVASGDPYRSVVYYRLAKHGPGRMPYFGSTLTHRAGLELLHEWIASLPAKPENVSEATRTLRKRQTELLSGLADKSSSAEQRNAMIDEMLSSTSGALMLARAIDRKLIESEASKQVLTKMTNATPAHVRDLFERFLPEDKRIKRLGNVIRPEMILRLDGDAERGRRLFFESKSVQCRSCHKIQNVGGEVGPDLSEIGGKYDRGALLDSILDPSKNVDPKFVAYLAETKRGKVHTGLMIRRDDKEIVLRDPQGKDVRLRVADVERLAPQQKSLMPELLLREMTAEDAADLLRYLQTLRKK